ncbi:MAG TPA: endolytic transglycosylase MltG, partial [Rhodothermales bacterium]|nr:endolytic transglycosylase MltG [Rhodothermales bacterium]
QKLRRGEQTAVRVTVPPGATRERIAAVAGRHLYAGPEGMLRALESDSLARALGTTPTALLGRMLPDTYRFFWLTQPEKVVARIHETFVDYVKGLGTPPQDLSTDDVATLASIVEWETAIDDERPRVAGVYLNRLRIGMPLQADPTVQFALLEREGRKRRLLFADYRLSHPFNTYLIRGLPPGPITNPSRTALKAVVEPEQHEYLYFVARGDGSHTFSRTLAEHNRAAEEYYRLMRERRATQARQNGS